jgi:phosphonoacetaldehyde hydrolase
MKFDYLKAVILDWAGTAVDFGSRAPVAALQRVFAASGVAITAAEAREDMGVLKKDQIRFIMSRDRVRNQWTQTHGYTPSEADVERIFVEFLPRQTEILAEFSEPIAGVCQTVSEWRRAGLKIGSTTGYTRALLDVVMEAAAQHGYAPDASVTPDQVGAGRPAPFMCYQNAIALQTYPLSACVKIGDTPSDIAEGRNAGMWTIGITRTGNEIGLSQPALEALPVEEQQVLEERAGTRLRAARAHFLARSVAECTPVLREIEQRIAAGEPPRLGPR